MTGRSTSWFDRDELKSLFKGVRPPRALEPASEPAEAAEASSIRAPAPEIVPEPPPTSSLPPVTTSEPALASPVAPLFEPSPPHPEEGGAVAAEAPTVPAAEAPQPPGPEAAPPPVPEASRPIAEPPPAAPPLTVPSVVAPPVVAAPPTADPASEALWRQSEALLDLARGQAAAQALEERLWEITETAASVLSLARASVWTFEDEERTRITCADFYSAVRDAHESGQAQSARDFPLYFAALHSERPIVAHDARADPRTRELPGGTSSVSQARIEAPVFVAGRLAGVLRLEHEGSPRRFEHHEERFAASLGDLAGLALEAQERRLKEAVARVGEERVRAQRDALAELSRGEALARGQIEGLLHEVTEAAVRVLRVERASVWVYAPDYESLFCLDAFDRAAARHGRGTELPREAAPAYFEALREGGRLVTTDARADLRLAELLRDGIVPPGISARLEAPIHLVGRLAGALWCERAGAPRTWLADEERFAEALAGFVALSIATSERRRTDNELRRVLEDLDRPGPQPGGTTGAESPPRGQGAASVPEGFDEDLGDA